MVSVADVRKQETETWTILLGSDIVIALGADSMHKDRPDEVAHSIDLEASPTRALTAATTAATRAAWSSDVDHLSPDVYADMVVVEGRPHGNPRTIADPTAVARGEEIVG